MSFIESVKEAKTGMTFTPQVFLPMIPLSQTESEAFINGNITIKLICDNWKEITEQLRSKYNYHELYLSDLYTLAFTMMPLVYENQKVIKPNRRLRELGEYTVVIIRPDYFTQIFSDIVYRVFPNLRYPEIAAVQYRKSQSFIEEYDIYEKPWNESWKKVFLFTTSISSNLSIIKEDLSPVELNLGDLSNIGVCVKTEELVEGKFPQEMLGYDMIQYLDSFSLSLKGIQGWCFSVTEEVMDITPTDSWIQRFRKVLSEDDWVVNTVIEKFRPDTQGLP